MANIISALGLMSGTSLDGIDVALVTSDGEAALTRGPFRSYPYDAGQRARLAAGLQAAAGLTRRDARPGDLAALEADLTSWHAEAVARFLAETGTDPASIGLIGFHGQTVLHRPEQRLTVQLGDGAALARRTGITTVSDMRAADVASGGQGAPLVPAYHWALAQSLKVRPVAFVNVGGVANVTWVGPDGSLMAFDTGPGNALLDDWALAHTGRAVDVDGALARAGRVSEAHVAAALAHPFFAAEPPKSLDRNSFAGHVRLDGLSAADGAATLAAITGRSIAAAARWFPYEPVCWIICGGGRRNPVLLEAIASAVSEPVLTAEEQGFDGDAMEAEAWAYLAIRASLGLPLSFPSTTGVATAMTGGVISAPSGG